MERYLIIFKGQVQGVGFRYTAGVVAKKYNLTGYAQNLYTSGDVRVEIQGEKENIEDYSLKKIELVNNEKGFGVRY